MNALLNSTQIWYCDICDKIIDIKSKSKLFKSRTHVHKKQYSSVVKRYEFIRPETHKGKYILNGTQKAFRYKFVSFI